MRPFLTLASRTISPVVLTCEHASSRLPGEGALDAAEHEVLRSHWGWDIGAWALTRELSRALETSAIGGRWSRLWIDLNRRVDDPTLIRRRAGELDLSWNVRVGVTETERRVLECHTPYHVEVDRLILRRLVRGVRPLVFAIHTFTPRFDGRLREFDAGVLFEHDRDLARMLAREMRRAGLRVRYNEPYSGMAGMMYSVDRHGKHHGLRCLELELNQELFAAPGVAARLCPVVARGIRRMITARER